MRDNEQQVEKKELHRVKLEFEPGRGPKLTLIHPKGGCQAATECGECGMGVGDPEFPGCEFCLTVDEMLAGDLEFPVTAKCDGEDFTLHIAAEPDAASTQQKNQADA